MRADEGSAHLSSDGASIDSPLRPDLPRGSYAVTWRVVSADTHVVSGSITFGVGQDAATLAAPPAGRSASLTLAADVARGVLYVGLVLSMGVALEGRTLWPWALGLTRIRVLTAFGRVSTLVLSGQYQALRQVRPVEAMWWTGYGVTLSVKLAIVTVMLALAYLGQRRLDPKTLQRTVPAEAVLGLAVVVVTTALVSQAPARATYGPPVTLTAPLGDRSAQVRLDITRRGPTAISGDGTEFRGVRGSGHIP